MVKSDLLPGIGDKTHSTVLRIDEILDILNKAQTNAISNNPSAERCIMCSELERLVPYVSYKLLHKCC